MPGPLIIPTARDGVILRQLVIDDAPALFELIDKNRDYLRPWWDDELCPLYPDLRAVMRSIFAPPESRQLRLGIWNDGELCGEISVAFDIYTPRTGCTGYWVAPESAGRGIATSALKAITGYAFQTYGAKSVEALVDKENGASRTVLARVGYRSWDADRTGRLIYCLPRAQYAE